MAGPVVRFRIDFAEHSSIGPGKIRLLEAIRDSGSLSQGARNIGMSYRRAWLLVESLRQSFREPVTVASTGGKEDRLQTCFAGIRTAPPEHAL
jgi:molybdate transport system regulatory protein